MHKTWRGKKAVVQDVQIKHHLLVDPARSPWWTATTAAAAAASTTIVTSTPWCPSGMLNDDSGNHAIKSHILIQCMANIIMQYQKTQTFYYF